MESSDYWNWIRSSCLRQVQLWWASTHEPLLMNNSKLATMDGNKWVHDILWMDELIYDLNEVVNTLYVTPQELKQSLCLFWSPIQQGSLHFWLCNIFQEANGDFCRAPATVAWHYSSASVWMVKHSYWRGERAYKKPNKRFRGAEWEMTDKAGFF